MLTLPVTDYPDYREEVTIEGLLYAFHFMWNIRGQFWTVSIADRDGTALVDGVKVMIGTDTFGRYRRVVLPSGQVIAFRDSGTYEEIAEGEIGNTVNLFYITEADLAA
jgi:hypothetical protein